MADKHMMHRRRSRSRRRISHPLALNTGPCDPTGGTTGCTWEAGGGGEGPREAAPFWGLPAARPLLAGTSGLVGRLEGPGAASSGPWEAWKLAAAPGLGPAGTWGWVLSLGCLLGVMRCGDATCRAGPGMCCCQHNADAWLIMTASCRSNAAQSGLGQQAMSKAAIPGRHLGQASKNPHACGSWNSLQPQVRWL